MPVRLPNGVLVMNVTPHVLVFSHRDWEDVIEVQSERVVSADAQDEKFSSTEEVVFVRMFFKPRKEVLEWIDEIKTLYPNVILVGSVVAAQAYPEEIVAPIPWYRGERGGKRDSKALMKPDKFTIFPKGEVNHGKLQTR